MIGRVTHRLTAIIHELMKAGYAGEAKLSDTGCSGTANVLQGALAVQLSGFCKESLYLVDDEDNQQFILIGRYDKEATLAYNELTIAYLTGLAWSFYRTYKGRGYGRPFEWEKLFQEHGYITTKTVTETRVIEKD